MDSPRRSFVRRTVGVVAFAAAMGYVESAVVVDLRAALGLPAAPSFPMAAATPGSQEHLALIEVGRELATLVMLVGVGLAVSRRGWEWLAWTAVAFGVWDITYYLWLALFIGWPGSPGDLDLLFLLPVPWVGPVWAPVAVSVALIGVGLAAAWRYAVGPEPRVRPRDVAAGVVGGAIVLLSFMVDAPRIVAGGLPGPFAWPLFAAGMVVALAGAWDALRIRRPLPPAAPVASPVTEHL